MSTAAISRLTNNPGQAYVLNSTEFIIPVNIAPGGETHNIFCRMRRATLPELLQRERESVTEIKPVAGGESIIVTNDRQANINLFKKIALGVTGLTEDGAEIEAGERLFANMNTGWMHNAVQGHYKSHAKLQWNPRKAFIATDR